MAEKDRFGQLEAYTQMAAKRPTENCKIRKGFWPGTETVENVPRRHLRSRLHHDQQTIPLQIRAMREYAARRGWTIALQVKEVGRAPRNGNCGRSCWTRRAAVRSTSCWCGGWIAGDGRWRTCSRRSKNCHLGVGFVSLTEALDLTTAAGRAMAGLLAVFAEFEREILRERVRAGLAHARQNGKRLGRPITARIHADQVRKLHRASVSKAEIARRLQIGRTSVRRILG
jgi:putative DNA-invertase from lambdoid prophage Rac